MKIAVKALYTIYLFLILWKEELLFFFYLFFFLVFVLFTLSYVLDNFFLVDIFYSRCINIYVNIVDVYEECKTVLISFRIFLFKFQKGTFIISFVI